MTQFSNHRGQVKGWFEVDKEGLGKLVSDRGKVFILHELVQNAWDEPQTSRVDVVLEPAPDLGRSLARLRVTDDNPRGFAHLSHAFTLFAESMKKGDERQRGRWNLGEKLVLSLCRDASIASTTGTVKFNADSTRTLSKVRTEKGSIFTATVKMSLAEITEAGKRFTLLLPPQRVTTTFNSQHLHNREPLLTFECTLPTVKADEAGDLRRTVRLTEVEVYEPQEGEEPHLFELGIPVVPHARFHVNVLQKIPLNMTRDNVTPAYQKQLHALVLDHTSHLLKGDEVAAPWVGEALERASPEAVAHVVNERFGKDAVVRDPSDPEANNRAAASGAAVVGGRTFSEKTWERIREAGVLPAAGKVFPTEKPYSDSPDAPLVKTVKEADWSENIKEVVSLAKSLAWKLMVVDLRVLIVVDLGMKHGACYGGGRLDLNLARLGHDFFNYREDPERVLDLLIHEFAHEYSSNHLSDDYYNALSKLGAKLAVAAADNPDLLLLGK